MTTKTLTELKRVWERFKTFPTTDTSKALSDVLYPNIAHLISTAEKAQRMEQALRHASKLIESEYCSHSGDHASGVQGCYTDFIHALIDPAPNPTP